MTHEVEERLLPAWDDPVHAAQSTFRAVLKALSEPGKTQPVAPAIAGPSPLMPATTSVLLALADHDTPVWLDHGAARHAVAAYLRFHCGCPLTADATAAAFAVITDLSQPLDFGRFAQGSPEYPDRSTTLLIQVPDLHTGPMRALRGPGIETTLVFAAAGLPADFTAQWRRNAARFPLGVDVLFCCGDTIAGLPRTTDLRDCAETKEATPCM